MLFIYSKMFMGIPRSQLLSNVLRTTAGTLYDTLYGPSAGEWPLYICMPLKGHPEVKDNLLYIVNGIFRERDVINN